MMVDRAADCSILGDDMLDTSDYDFDAALAAVTDHGTLLEYLSEDMQDDETIVSAAVREDPTSLVYASKRLRDKESIVALTPALVKPCIASANRGIRPRAKNTGKV